MIQPRTLNRQGNDVGTSYRSAIFYKDEEQKRSPKETLPDVNASDKWPGNVLTQVVPAGPFWQAEPEHQDYLEGFRTAIRVTKSDQSGKSHNETSRLSGGRADDRMPGKRILASWHATWPLKYRPARGRRKSPIPQEEVIS